MLIRQQRYDNGDMLLMLLSPIGFHCQFPEIQWWQLNRFGGGIGQSDFSAEDIIFL